MAPKKILEGEGLKLFRLTTEQEGYTKSFDGTEIYFRSVGKGPIPLICCNGLSCNDLFWTYFVRHFRREFQIVTWDYRGHGRSSLKRNPKNYTTLALVKDLQAVLKKLKIKKGIFLGHSLGMQVILELYRRQPECLAGIVSCFGTYGHLMDHFYNSKLSPLIFRLVYFLGTTFPKQSNLLSRIFLTNPLSYWASGVFKVSNTGMMSREEVEQYVQHVLSVDPELFSHLLKSMHESSAEDVLKKVKVPTLVIAGEEDQFTPAWIARKMARLLPKAELMMIHKATHAGLMEQPDLINLRIEKFFEEKFLQKPVPHLPRHRPE